MKPQILILSLTLSEEDREREGGGGVGKKHPILDLGKAVGSPQAGISLKRSPVFLENGFASVSLLCSVIVWEQDMGGMAIVQICSGFQRQQLGALSLLPFLQLEVCSTFLWPAHLGS